MPSTHPDPDPPTATGHGGTAAGVLRRTLEAMGVEHLFGMDAPAALHAELTGSAITPITARDERSAGFMADAYAKVRDRVVRWMNEEEEVPAAGAVAGTASQESRLVAGREGS